MPVLFDVLYLHSVIVRSLSLRIWDVNLSLPIWDVMHINQNDLTPYITLITSNASFKIPKIYLCG